jgi:alpha-1,6-mannosyltransferase
VSRRLAIAGAATGLLYLAILGLQPVFLISSPRLVELQPWMQRFVRIPPSLPEPWLGVHAILAKPAVTAGVWAAIVIALFALYGLAFRAVRRGAGSVGAVLGGYLLFAAVLAPGLPIFSHDVFSYIAHGELVDTKHVSPYEVRMEDHRDLAVSRWAPRMRLGSVYGPLALRVFQALHVTGASALANLMIFRTFAIAALFVALVLAYRTLVGLGRDPREARALLLLFAWNPLVLLDGVLNAHVDVLIVVLLAAGVLLVVRQRTVVGLAVIATSAAVKITFLYLAPVLVAWAFRSAAAEGDARPRAGAFRVLQLVALGAGLHLCWLLPDWIGGGPWTALSELRGYAANSLAFVMKQGLLALGLRVESLPEVAIAAFALVVGYRAWELHTLGALLARLSRDVMISLLFFLPVVYPWYALAAFPLVVPAGSRRDVAALVTLSAGVLLAFYGERMFVVLAAADTKLVKFALGVLPAACVFLFASRAARAGP